MDNTIRFLYLYNSFCILNNNIRQQIQFPHSFPKKIRNPITEIRTNKKFILRIIYIELIDGKIFSGFIVVLKPEFFEKYKELREVLLFVDICNIYEYGEYVASGPEIDDLASNKWISCIAIKFIKALYY